MERPSRNTQDYKYPSIDHFKLNTKRTWGGTGPEAENHLWYFEEKIDGSQFSFYVDGEGLHGFCRGSTVDPRNSTFANTIDLLTVHSKVVEFNPNLRYDGEAIRAKRHNVVQYDRTPSFYFVLYDIYHLGDRRWFSLDEKRSEAKRLGLEMVQVVYENHDPECSPTDVGRRLLQDIEEERLTSMLGGRPEGLVLKHHHFFSRDKYVATKMKLVTEAFKESHVLKQPPKEQVTPDSAIQEIGKAFALPARFQKGFQRLSDRQELSGDIDKDFKKIIEDLDADLEKEYGLELREYLWAELRSFVYRATRAGLREWLTAKYA